MKIYKSIFFAITIIASSFLQSEKAFSDDINNQIKLPKGFKISVFAENINNARQLAIGSKGTVFVGTTQATVYAITPNKKVYKIATNLFHPNGVAFKNGSLYVGETNKISKYENIESNLDNPPKAKIIYDKLNSKTHHGYRYIKFSPDGKLYISVGMPCNVCEASEKKLGTISKMNDDGSGFSVFSKGIRNSMGFDWSTKKELWFTDNGRDFLGDDLPPDEVNKAENKNEDFGYPYCHAGYISDPDFGKKKSCSDFKKPEINLKAHVAPLGLSFYKGKTFPSIYQNQIFIAEHGSWNRSKPIGYRIMNVFIKDNKAVEYNVFAEGWLKKDNNVIGRPVDIINYNDGSILISDDYSNKIYKIEYK